LSERFAVAYLVRPRGLRGEISADRAGLSAAEIRALPALFLEPPGSSVVVESVRDHQDRLLIKLKGIDSMDAAEALRGAELTVDRADLPPTEEGEYYFGDLMGCTVMDTKSGEAIGVVANCVRYGGPMLLEVKRSGKSDVLIPFVKAICPQVDLEAKRILADLPEGLIEAQQER
jgi:16S rRNA processing protein RimM